MFQVHRIYHRKNDIHSVYGGQQQSGIITPAKHPMVLVVTGAKGKQYGYADEWDGRTLLYFGQGQEGDMQFGRGNKALRDHQKNGKDLHVFSQTTPGYLRYEGQFVCAGSE